MNFLVYTGVESLKNILLGDAVVVLLPELEAPSFRVVVPEISLQSVWRFTLDVLNFGLDKEVSGKETAGVSGLRLLRLPDLLKNAHAHLLDVDVRLNLLNHLEEKNSGRAGVELVEYAAGLLRSHFVLDLLLDRAVLLGLFLLLWLLYDALLFARRLNYAGHVQVGIEVLEGLLQHVLHLLHARLLLLHVARHQEPLHALEQLVCALALLPVLFVELLPLSLSV